MGYGADGSPGRPLFAHRVTVVVDQVHAGGDAQHVDQRRQHGQHEVHRPPAVVQQRQGPCRAIQCAGQHQHGQAEAFQLQPGHQEGHDARDSGKFKHQALAFLVNRGGVDRRTTQSQFCLRHAELFSGHAADLLDRGRTIGLAQLGYHQHNASRPVVGPHQYSAEPAQSLCLGQAQRRGRQLPESSTSREGSLEEIGAVLVSRSRGGADQSVGKLIDLRVVQSACRPTDDRNLIPPEVLLEPSVLLGLVETTWQPLSGIVRVAVQRPLGTDPKPRQGTSHRNQDGHSVADGERALVCRQAIGILTHSRLRRWWAWSASFLSAALPPVAGERLAPSGSIPALHRGRSFLTAPSVVAELPFFLATARAGQAASAPSRNSLKIRLNSPGCSMGGAWPQRSM